MESLYDNSVVHDNMQLYLLGSYGGHNPASISSKDNKV